MKSNRETAISETLKWEGGYTNDKADPGGPTNWGITIADARRFWKSDASAADVKLMPKSIAIDIYRQKYWKTDYYDCDKLAPGVDLSTFDFGVNSGPSRAKKYLDKAVGGTDVDTINKLNDARLTFLKGLKTWPVFGKGWGRRVAGIRSRALEMSAGALKPSEGSKTKVGVFATILAGLAASYHWVLAHKGIMIVGTIVGTLLVLELIRIWKKGNANVNVKPRLVQGS